MPETDEIIELFNKTSGITDPPPQDPPKDPPPQDPPADPPPQDPPKDDPPADPPKDDPPANPFDDPPKDPPADPPDDLDVKKYFGDDIESIDQVKEYIERAKKFTPDTEKEIEALRQSAKKVEEYEKMINELKNKPAFKNEKLYKLDRLEEKDPEKASVYQKYLLGDTDDAQIVKLRMMLDHPNRFKDNPGYLDRMLEKKYPILFDPDADKDDHEYKDALVELGLEADTARQKFESELSEIEVPKPKSKEDIEAEQKEFIEKWKEPFGKVKEGVKKLSIPVTNEKDPKKNDVLAEYEIPEGDLKEIQNIAANHILSQNLPPDEKSVKEATEVALGVYLVRNFAKINTYIANMVASKEGGKWRSKINNPEKPGGDVKKPPAEDKTPQEGSPDAILSDILSS